LPPLIEPKLGDFADRYTLVGWLGRGGSATVYRAFDSKRKAYVALKALTDDSWELERWKAEIDRMRRLPKLGLTHVLAVGDDGVADGFPYFAMPLCSGGSFDDWVAKHGPMALWDLVPVLRAVALDLECAHANDIIHRDIKPSNLLLVAQSVGLDDFVIADWGIAKELNRNGSTTNFVLGSERYMSLRRRQGLKATALDDEYSLAKTAEDLLCGYHGRDDETSEHARVNLAREVARVLETAMADDPDAQYPTLSSFVVDFTLAARSATEARTRRRPRLWSAQDQRGGAVRDLAGPVRLGEDEEEAALLALSLNAEKLRSERPEYGLKSDRDGAERARARAVAERDKARAKAKEEERRRRAAEQKSGAFAREIERLKRTLARTVEAASASARASEASAKASARIAASLGVEEEQAQGEMYAAQAGGGGSVNVGAPYSGTKADTARGGGDRVVSLGDFRSRKRQGSPRSEALKTGGYPPGTAASSQSWVSRSIDAAREGESLAFANATLYLTIAVVAGAGAALGALGKGLPGEVAGPLAAVSIAALALAAILRAYSALIRGRADGLPATVSVLSGIAAVIVGYVALRHHTSPWLLAPGEWWVVGVVFLLISILFTFTGPLLVRLLLMLIRLVVVTVAMTMAVRQAPLVVALVVLTIFLVPLGVLTLATKHAGSVRPESLS
jgi:hypothetical protein